MTGLPSRTPNRPPPCRAARRPVGAGGLDRRLALLGLALLTGACAETGDFGRPRPTVLTTQVLPAAGLLAAWSRDEPVSPYRFTDDEDELRHRAWRFLMPAHERAHLERVAADLVRHRILPLEARPRDIGTYHRALTGGPARSPASLYRRLSEDTAADAALSVPFARVAARVIEADRVRLKALVHVRVLVDGEPYAAAARVAENRCLIAWVRQSLAERAGAYRFALERLFLEAPQGEAVEAERALARLDLARRALEVLPVPPLADVACAGFEAGRERFTPRDARPVAAKG
jgi:hypothetical protein